MLGPPRRGYTLIRISVQACINFPTRSLKKSARKNLSVKVAELPPDSVSDPELPIPAIFEFRNGELSEDDQVSFDPPRFFQTDLESHSAWNLDFNVCDGHGNVIGCAKIGVGDLARRNAWRLLLQDPSAFNPLYTSDITSSHQYRKLTRRGETVRRPTLLLLAVEILGGVQEEDVQHRRSSSWQRTRPAAGMVRPRRLDDRTRVMVMTRGTRGDVQPFVALARGLILYHHCEVTICTELTWKSFIKEFRDGLPQGTLLFRPSGGDTMAQTRTAISKLITWEGQHYDFLQSLIFSAQERNFFPSEGCFYFWAAEERPDFIIFGFTVCHLAMLVGEALSIPIVGFICQPDHKIEERRDTSTHIDQLLEPTRKAMNSEGFNAALMSVMQQMSVGGPSLNCLRRTRGLITVPAGLTDSMVHFDELQKQGVPMIVPISPVAVGDYAHQLQQYILTDFVYLRTVKDVLDAELVGFVHQAKAIGRRILLITFSSMPVGERMILELALEACNSDQLLFPPKPPAPNGPKLAIAVIAMTGGQNHDKPSAECLERCQQLCKDGRLLMRSKGASFAALFPLLDAVIGQGGLGVTSEALRAGVPVITSGILLLDQRWWAARVKDLGCGSKPVKVDRLLKWDYNVGAPRVVGMLHKALRDVSDDGQQTWTQRAKQVSMMLHRAAGPDPDGILRNSQAVFQAGTQDAVTLEECYAEGRDCCSCLSRQARCCCRCIEQCLRCIFFMNVPTMLYVCVLFVAQFVCCLPCRRVCCQGRRSKCLAAKEEPEEEDSNVTDSCEETESEDSSSVP
ncbi:tylN [Symbiodinium natans]|uniref:TylN protein n=1 Tax=Symbiodinium natans TaxID=878477 RepID=A0A812IA19_9DINO|nr:tylN [Symbiodinium natans]